MFQNVYNKPSFYSHIFTGLISLFFILIIFIYYNKLNLNFYQKLILLLLFAILIGIHGLSHLFLEVYYNFNPLQHL